MLVLVGGGCGESKLAQTWGVAMVVRGWVGGAETGEPDTMFSSATAKGQATSGCCVKVDLCV